MPDLKIPSKDPNMDFTVVTVKSEKPDLREKEKPLIDLKVTNPITYIKSWWKKIIGNEGIEMKIKVKPLTAIAIAIIAVSVSFGVGKFVVPIKTPFFEYSIKNNEIIPTPIIPPVAKTLRDTAFTGVLKFDESKNKFYLFTLTSEAINLSVPNNINLTQFVGRRIFAAGKYDEGVRTLEVETASDMEILPVKIVPIPTEIPTITPTIEPTI